MAESAGDNRFSFAQVQERLKDDVELDPLWRSLDRDYRMISYLLEHAPALGMHSFEDRLLVWDYRIMQFWYRVARIMAPLRARAALGEMASVLSALAQKLGEQAGLRYQA